MNKTTVVNIRNHSPMDHYVGRANPRRGLKGHSLANPYKLGKDGDRKQVIAKYNRWLAGLLKGAPLSTHRLLQFLRGGRLGCWCWPEACHADTLALLADMSIEEREAWADGILQVEGTSE